MNKTGKQNSRQRRYCYLFTYIYLHQHINKSNVKFESSFIPSIFSSRVCVVKATDLKKLKRKFEKFDTLPI